MTKLAVALLYVFKEFFAGVQFKTMAALESGSCLYKNAVSSVSRSSAANPSLYLGSAHVPHLSLEFTDLPLQGGNTLFLLSHIL